MDGRRDGRFDYYTPPKVPLGAQKTVLLKIIEPGIAANPECMNSSSLNKA